MSPTLSEFFRACADGDLGALRTRLDAEPGLVREGTPDGSTPLHLAIRHPEALGLLIERGADPNRRDTGDNASPLHFAAAQGLLESVRILLDAGADVHGSGDLHESGAIGWAARPGNEAVVGLLLERGARHHIFSAMATGDLDLVRQVVEADPESLARRRSRFENRHTPLHAVFAPPDGLGHLTGTPNYAMLQLLIGLGADLDATDDKGRTPFETAMLRGDIDAIRILKAAGAKEPEQAAGTDTRGRMAALAASIKKSDPMFSVADMRATVQWYQSIGFTVLHQHEDGELMFAKIGFGACEFGLSPGGASGPRGVSLWFYTDRVQDLYQILKDRQIRAAQAALAGSSAETGVRFLEDLYSPFYGGRQFSIEDPNGLTLIFWHPDWL